MSTHWITAADGTRLLVREFQPAKRPGERTLLWTHGMAEHGGRYDHVIERLTAGGWRVLLADLRGHGHSQGTRTHVESFSDYVDDLVRIWTHFDCEPARTALLGNSMGGLITVRAVQSQQIQPAAAVLIAPLLGVGVRVPPYLEKLGRMLLPLFPRLRFNSRIDPANMTHDPEMQRLRRADPLMLRTVTGGWYFAMRQALAAAYLEAERVSLPLLVLQGTADVTVDPAKAADWIRSTASEDQQVVYLDDQLHELFHEPQWPATLALVQQWLDERVR